MPCRVLNLPLATPYAVSGHPNQMSNDTSTGKNDLLTSETTALIAPHSGDVYDRFSKGRKQIILITVSSCCLLMRTYSYLEI